MITFNAELHKLLINAPDKRMWSTIIATALGPNRFIRCKRSTTVTDVWGTGVEFFNVGIAGPVEMVSGNIASFGKTKKITIRKAADLATGASVLRIEGNGNWIQGTLGLVGSGCDFMFSKNPTEKSGLGFINATIVNAPELLPSGTGPTIPALTSTAPSTLEIWDWAVPSAPVLRGTIEYNTRVEDYVYEDAEMAAENGDIAVWQSNQSVVHGQFEFGTTMLASTYTNTTSMDEPLYQVMVYCKPYGQGWDTYPALTTYKLKVNKTQPTPFKAILKDKKGNILHTFEMRDGLPINSPELSQGMTIDKPIRPLWNCAMMLPWQNRKPSLSIHQKKRFNGMDPEILRPDIGKRGHSNVAVFPMLSASWSANGLMNMWAMPQWAMKAVNHDNIQGDIQYQIETDVYGGKPYARDPNLFDVLNYNAYQGKIYRTTGWGYEPGANGGHDWYCAPGGPRWDRAPVPSVLAVYMTKKDFVRPQNNVPIKDMVDAWGLTYFNHSSYYVRNVKTMESVPKDEIMRGEWSYNWGYYSARPQSENGNKPEQCVEIAPVLNSGNVADWNLDKDGLQPYSGWAPDALHGYNAPNLWSIMFNSPMHSIAGVHRYITASMATLNNDRPTDNPFDYWMQRTHAWRWMHYTYAWKNGSKHSLGLSQKQIEDKMQFEMELAWEVIYKPTMVDQTTSNLSCVIFRTMGAQNSWNPNYKGFTSGGGGLGFYLGQVFAFMKQFGLWETMKAKSSKCADILRFLIRCYDMSSVDYVLDTSASDNGYPVITRSEADGVGLTLADVPTSWADWQQRFPAEGLSDMIRDKDGNILDTEREINIHWRASWPIIHKNYFPEAEYAFPRLDAAIAKYKQYDLDKKAHYTSGKGSDWCWRLPCSGFMNPPGQSDSPRQ
jgi:hypothetical protein